MIVKLISREMTKTKQGNPSMKLFVEVNGEAKTKYVNGKAIENFAQAPDGELLNLIMSEDGKWINGWETVKDAHEEALPNAPVYQSPTPKEVKQAYEEATGKMTKNDWAEKDKVTRKSIERQKASDVAMQSWVSDKITEDKYIKLCQRIEQYYETGE
jgi:hypothetical protein